ncbi:unnamed protein product [Caretta caretta]
MCLLFWSERTPPREKVCTALTLICWWPVDPAAGERSVSVSAVYLVLASVRHQPADGPGEDSYVSFSL